MNDINEKYSQEEYACMDKMGTLLENELKELDWKKTQEELPYKKNRNQKRKTFITNELIAEKFGINRTKLTMYLNGHQPIDALTLLKFCELLDCEAGYLLGEFDERKKTDTDVKKATGLSPEAINTLNQNKNSVIYDKTVRTKDSTDVILAPLDEKDIIPEHSTYSDVLNSILVHYPDIITMIGRILFCKELCLEHYVGNKFVSGLQPNAQAGIVQNNTYEMCMSLAMYLYHLSEGINEHISTSLSVTDNFNFAQKYITNHVVALTSENVHLKNEILNMEQDNGYQFGARPY